MDGIPTNSRILLNYTTPPILSCIWSKVLMILIKRSSETNLNSRRLSLGGKGRRTRQDSYFLDLPVTTQVFRFGTRVSYVGPSVSSLVQLLCL